MTKRFFIFCIAGAALLLASQTIMAGEIIKNYANQAQCEAIKKSLDDPRPYVKTQIKLWGTEVYDYLSFDVEEGSRRWAEMVGFKSPDLVGKIAPEIKPGKYTLNDKNKYPFDKLMPPMFYERFNEPGAQGKNFAANFTEFEVVPTRQYWMHLSVAEASIKNEGTAKLDEQGYHDYSYYKGGIPFPKPSGEYKGWQVIHNCVDSYNYGGGEEYFSPVAAYGIDNNFKIDRHSVGDYYSFRTYARVIREPKGMWFDKRAQEQGEKELIYYEALEPRDLYGNAYIWIKTVDPDATDNLMVYTPLTRRIRKMSSSDRQDQAIGLDYTYDDINFLNQKLTGDAYPYKVRIIEEREYLVPFYTMTGDEYYDSKSRFLWRNLEFERRPLYVVEMEQLDPTYVYSKRVYYVDKETFEFVAGLFYDQKGRLWRSMNVLWAFVPETGTFMWLCANYFDHIDVHTTLEQDYVIPSLDADRSEFSARRLMRGRK